MIGISDLEYLCAEVRQIARKAGAFLRDERQKFDRERVEEKSAHNYVSYVDKESERRLVEQLSTLLPEAGFIAEEGSGSLTDEEYCWVIDPLDGTNNYSQGLPVFTVSIGLQYREETILGVVYAPYLGELYTAIRDRGARYNGKVIRVAEKQDLAHSVLGTGFPYDKDVNPDNNAANLAAILPSIRGIRRMGSAAYDLCCVAAGWLDGYWELALQPWDMCAGALIVQEAGGIVRRFRENRGISILAGNAALVEKMGEKIQ